MKLVLFFARHFSFKTARKSLTDFPDATRTEGAAENAVVVFFHVEEQDVENLAGVIRKFTKNTKWLCGKFASRTVVLHSFNHLSSSKAPPDVSKQILEEVVRRLEKTGYTVMATPFGYFNEFSLHVAGDSLAKVFKEF